MKNPKVIIVMPAYNAEKTIRDTYNEIPLHFRKFIILVDDRSSDNTVSVAKSLGIAVFTHTQNLGYGGNQKTCYYEALKLNPDIVVMLHPDYQYDASLIEELMRPINMGRFDFMFGSRVQSKQSAISGGMPKLKYYINRITCILENILLGVNFTEHFSGFRAYSAKLLKTVPFQRFSNDFVFDQQMEVAALNLGFKIGEIPIPTRYHEKASSIQFIKGTKFILETFWTILIYKLHRLVGIRNKLLLLAIIFGNLWIWRIFKENFIIGILLVILSFLLFKQIVIKVQKGQLVALIFIVIIITLRSLEVGFDRNIFTISVEEQAQQNARHSLYSVELGQLFKNKLSLHFYKDFSWSIRKLERNLFYNLDPNLYFFASHPRERPGIVEFDKYPWILQPFFIVGLFLVIQNYYSTSVIYFIGAAFISMFFSPVYTLGPVLFFPLINVVITLGLLYFFKFVKNKTRGFKL